MLEPRVPPPRLDNPTYAYFHIQIDNNRLLTHTDYTATPNPSLPLAYNVWRQITSTTGQLWEVHLRNDLPYYHITRHSLHRLTDTIDGFQMAISLRYWLFFAHPLQHDLLLEYDITDGVPADHPRHTHHNIDPHATPHVTYPQHTQRVPDATQDGDVEPNPGPDNSTPPHGMVRTLAENYERNASGRHTDKRDAEDVEENPLDTLETNPHPPLEDNTAREPPQNGEPNTPPDHHADGFSYSPPSPQEDTQAYTFHEDCNNPLDKLPIHTPTEYQLIEELVKLNTGTPQQPMTTAEQETLKASIVYDAQTSLKAYLTKHPNRAVTTEHIRWQTQAGVWYDRNTNSPCLLNTRCATS